MEFQSFEFKTPIVVERFYLSVDTRAESDRMDTYRGGSND